MGGTAIVFFDIVSFSNKMVCLFLPPTDFCEMVRLFAVFAGFTGGRTTPWFMLRSLLWMSAEILLFLVVLFRY